ncbi:MAG: 1,4-alpha-glucan branching protein GlgB [Lachnospiraceae bacterium]|nr:1,4-alpha-glucan branching protein GlgB [Lachnospiraceae bacterium]
MDKRLYKMMDWARVEQIVYSEEDDPHGYLGAHAVKGGWMISCFIPGAKKCSVVMSQKEYKMDMMDEEGFFSVLIRSITKSRISYKFKVTKGKNTYITDDPYRFSPTIDNKTLKAFSAGICYDIYEYLGAHVRKKEGVTGVSFAVWAPNAIRVSVVGDFNDWDGRSHQMRRLGDSGVFELFIPGIASGENYKYELKLKGGMVILKADPYGYFAQLRPETASTVFDIENYKWHDDDFVAKRAEFNSKDKPFSVYEIHLGAFKKPDDGREFLNYRELADEIIPYVLEMGYTHIELMPVMEHPFDESWGYQVIGMYAPTSRYGTPEDFMYFMDKMHENNIGVILDWVPAHFPRDVQGLSNFDGTCLYEHADPRQGYHPDWGTLCFNYGRPEVSDYLIANALFWIKKYHADGIRMDAVASMLYLDYGRRGGEWIPNIYGGNENIEAEEMLRHLNSINGKMKTGALMIAEESTAWPKVTGSLNDDGLGFDYKWNMGWMNDFLGFIRLDPLYRSGHYSELTFSMIYAYSEKFILVFSHDEVVHGKASMLSKMPGERDKKFANLRLSIAFMFTHPGKKLLFMGQDIGEWDEWNEKRSVQWDLLQYDDHIMFNGFVKGILDLYRKTPALYELDNDVEGFEWINNISANETIIVFLRKDKEGNNILVVCNFAGIDRTDYKIGVPFSGKYKEIFSTDDIAFGGKGHNNPRVKRSKDDECDTRQYSIRINVPALSVSIFTCTQCEPEELKYYHAPVKKRRRRKH